MRKLVYAALLALVVAFPAKGTDVGKLRPVEVISMAQTPAGYTIRTDTGDQGQGKTLREAYHDLKESTPGVIYLDTAEYLLQETPIEQLDMVKSLLKSDVRVCAAEQGIPLDGSGRYLDIHHPKTRLRDGTDYQKLEILWETDGQYRLE